MDVAQFADRLTQKDTPDTVLDLWTEAVRERGFDWSVLLVDDWPGAGPDGSGGLLRLAHHHPDWERHHRERRYDRVSPVYPVALGGTTTPVVFREVWRNCRRTPERAAYFADAEALSLIDGIALPVTDLSGAQGVACAVSSAAPEEARRLIDYNLADLFLMAHYLVHRLVGLRPDAGAGAAKPHLTAREIECLRWASIGKTSWEISRILSISEATVNFHLGNARRKLGAGSRGQAVAKAAQLRLLKP